MTDPKPPQPVAMTTTQRQAMDRYVNANAFGIGLREKLRQAYREGWKAKEASILSLEENKNENQTK